MKLRPIIDAAIAACDPARLVAAALPEERGRRFGVAVGKAALAMARGAGPVTAGVCIAPMRGEVPRGWQLVESAHPLPDERSVHAAQAARAVIAQARAEDQLLVLISGGASALLEEPRPGVTLAQIIATTQRVMASGAPIAELNAARAQLSAVKRGGLVAACAAPVVTLAISDVEGDAIEIIGSAPTLRTDPRDVARVIAPRALFADHVAQQLAAPRATQTLDRDVAACAELLLAGQGMLVAHGEPTLVLPADAGEGGRAQQLALLLARALRGTQRSALVLGSDGVDGPPPRDRPAPAGAFVDGGTWEALLAAGIDVDAAIARCAAGPALAAIGALVITGPTGINHGDLAVML